MDDARIVALLWARDEAALRAAEDCCGALCRALAQNLLGSREDAEECWSDALLRLWDSVPPERPDSLRAYLAKLTRRLAIDRLRAATAEKRGGGTVPLLLDELADCVSGREDAESETLSRALGEAVSRYLADQPPRTRALFVRRYFYGEAVNELARRFGLRENTVSVTLRRARLGLRAYLERAGFQP